MISDHPCFTERLQTALDFAARAHAPQLRKDPDWEIPYVAHVYGVATILLRHGFADEIVVAGLLHDVLEDQPARRDEMELLFGHDTIRLVEWVTEVKTGHDGRKLPWSVRKAAYNERMKSAPTAAKAISAADKIHNIQSSILVLRRGHNPWGKLTGSPAQHFQRYQDLLTILRESWTHPILDHYQSVLLTLRQLDERVLRDHARDQSPGSP